MKLFNRRQQRTEVNGLIYDRIDRICRLRGTTPSEVERVCGFAPGTIIKWKTSIPRADRLAAVAKALHTTSEALLAPEEDETEAI